MIEIMAAELPPGVLNVVSWLGGIAPRLTCHPSVAKVVFTGSTETERQVMESAATTLKHLTLELGGTTSVWCYRTPTHSGSPSESYRGHSETVGKPAPH